MGPTVDLLNDLIDALAPSAFALWLGPTETIDTTVSVSTITLYAINTHVGHKALRCLGETD
jgi:hypothetical protein